MPIKRLFALTFAILSGLYLVIMVPTLDPLPFLDEGLAGMIFLNCLAALGIDFRAIFGRRQVAPVEVSAKRR